MSATHLLSAVRPLFTIGSHMVETLADNSPGVRFAFYLDRLGADSGALRIIPGSVRRYPLS